MAAADLYKKLVYFLVVAVSVLVSLLILTFVEEIARQYLIDNLGFVVGTQGRLVSAGGENGASMMSATGVSLVENILKIVKVVLWMALVIAVVRMVTRLLLSSVLRGAVHAEITSLAKTVLSIIIYIVAFFIIFQSQYPGIELAPLFTGSAILGIVVGLALQDTLGNLFAGLAMQADQPFQVGDVIEISNRGGGVVESVSWRGVRIRTFQNKLLVISNAVLGRETIEVAPQNNLNARLVTFSTVFTDSPAKTTQVIREAVRQVDNVSQKIRPIVRIRRLAESGLEWEIKYWPENYAKYNDTDSQIRQRIWYAFQREGLTFPFPTRTIYNEALAAPVDADDLIHSATEHLSHVPIFAPLSGAEIDKLAKASSRRVFAPGEMIVRKGQEGGSMFIIVRGAVSVQLPGAEGPRTVNNLSANDFFGEMSLLTGEPRSANVVAEEETDVLQIRKSAIKPLFEANPDLMHAISLIVDERRKLLVEEVTKAKETEAPEPGVMQSIRKFFGLKEKN